MIRFLLISAIAAGLFHPSLSAQKFFTKAGQISFYSDTPMEKIEAHNNKAVSVLDTESGAMEFSVLIKGFQFEKALMQEHFNENYMESNTYPKSLFKGKITNMSAVNLQSDGTYDVTVAGELTIHGVTQSVETTGTMTVADGTLSAQSSFEVAVADYEIEIPKVVADNIAKVVRIDVTLDYQPLNQ